jgi:hypothetical protein
MFLEKGGAGAIRALKYQSYLLSVSLIRRSRGDELYAGASSKATAGSVIKPGI